MILNYFSRKIAGASNEAKTETELDEWLKAHGLKLNWQTQAVRLAVMLSPILSANLPFMKFG